MYENIKEKLPILYRIDNLKKIRSKCFFKEN